MVCVCVFTACCSGQGVKAVEAQTNKSEDKKDVPGETEEIKMLCSMDCVVWAV